MTEINPIILCQGSEGGGGVVTKIKTLDFTFILCLMQFQANRFDNFYDCFWVITYIECLV